MSATTPRASSRSRIRPDSQLRRSVDVAVAGCALVVLSPVLMVVGAWVRLTSRGPAIYRQTRVGRGARPFSLWKFRTMTVGADAQGPLVSGSQDPRITSVGRWLRATRLDELPQLANLLRGDLTLIGPRPEVPRYVRHYTAAEWESLLVRPGIVGPGTLLFAERQAEELDRAADPERCYIEHQLHLKLAQDLAYLEHRSLRVDLGIVVETARLVGRALVGRALAGRALAGRERRRR